MPRTPARDAAPSPQPATGNPAANLKRRRFLLALGAGTAGTAAASASALAAPVAITAQAGAAPASSGYQETDHVRDYYATARL
jgi:hypothetical protein